MPVSFRTIQLTDGKKRVNGALRARAAVRPALRQGSAFLLGLAGGWAVLYGALMPFGLGLTLGFAEDCFAVGAAGAALGVLARSFGTLTVESVCLLCALGAAVAARWLWPGRSVPAVAAGCGTLVGSAVCFAAGEENGVQTILFCGGNALLAAAAGYGLRRFPPEKPGMGSLILSAAAAAALGGMSFGFFLPGVMACALAELTLCCKGLPLEALAFSGVTGAALAASDPALAPAAAGLACGCAAAAVLAPARRVEGLAAYAGGCVAGVLCVQPLAGAFSFLLSAGAGAGLCALLPAGWLMHAIKKDEKNSNKKPTLQEHSQTVIIPQLSPEMLEQARRAAEQGKTAEQIEQEALAAAQAEQKAVGSKQEAPTAEKPKTVQPANKPKTRKEAEEELAQNIHDDHLWLNNPVMVRGLGLAPIVAAAVSGQNAWMLCAAAILLVTATRMLAVAICHLTGNRFRGVVYSYAAAIVYIPAYIILYNLFGADLSLLGIYLPMLVVEPAVIKRMESNDLETVGEAFRRGINNTIGICFSVLLVGVVRELLAEGTVFGNVVFPVAPLPLADQPGTGFIIIGLIAAVWTAIGGAYVHYKIEEVRHLYGNKRKR